MEIKQIVPGVKLVTGENFSILFGVPPEIIKYLMIEKIQFPDYIVIPDITARNGVLQNCTEFPLYYHVFMLGNFFRGIKLSILGNEKEIANNRELLRLTLLGPTEDEYKEFCPTPYSDELYREARYLSVKDKDGNEIPIEGFVNFVFFENDEIRNEYFTLVHTGVNEYTVNGETVFIPDEGIQSPAYELSPQYVPMIPHKFGVDILGGGSGFTPLKPSSAVLLNYNSDYMLVDCPAYLEYHLSARGISPRQVKSLFLTHIHDDHCNMFPLLKFTSKIRLLCTPEIYWMAIRKLTLMTGYSEESIRSSFDFIPVVPYEENDFYGISIIPHYTVHSIPTIGATFIMNDSGKQYSIVVGGDNKALREIAKMTENKIVPQKKTDYINMLYHERFDILIPDGGMGLLHGDPADSIKSKSDRVVFLHLEKLPPEFDAAFSLAESGKRYTLIEAKQSAYLIKGLQIFYKSFPGIPEEWFTTLMSSMNIVSCNAGDVVFKQGADRKGSIFIILYGVCSVMFHDGSLLREIAVKEAGDFIGEMAVVRNEPVRSASVVARTPVLLGEIDEKIFYMFLKSADKITDMMTMWEKRRELERCPPFSGFSTILNEKIARVSEKISVTAENDFIPQTDEDLFCIITDGEVTLYSGDRVLRTVGRGGTFTYSCSQNLYRVYALENIVILAMKVSDAQSIIADSPAFQFMGS